MACRGVFFALAPEQTQHLLSLTTDDKRLDYIQLCVCSSGFIPLLFVAAAF